MVIFLIIFCLVPGIAAASNLGDFIAAMKPGTWGTFTPTKNLGGADGGDGYQDSATWDPIAKKIRVCNSTDANPLVCYAYDDATDSWGSFATPYGTTYHTYDGQTIDPWTGTMYLREEGEGARAVYKYTEAGGWSALPLLPATGALSCCTTLVYTPDYHGGGLMFHGRGGFNVLFLPNGGSAWEQIPNTDAGGSTWVNGERDPINRIVMICTTNGTTCKKIDRNGVMTNAASNSSVTFYTGSGWTGHLSVDPVTGVFLALTDGLTNRHLWAYNARTDAWTQLADPPAGMTTGVLATPISTYGATAFVSCSSGASCSGSPIYIYKYTAASAADIDYANRCAAPGIVKCNSLDTISTSSADITGKDLIRYDHNAAQGNLLPNGGNVYYGSLDTTIKRSGAGSLKFQLAAGVATANIAGQYLPQTNNGLGATFGQNSDLYVQVAVRMSPEYFTNQLNYWDSVAKIMILHANQISCGNHELTTNQWVRDGGNSLLAGYQECGGNGWRTGLDGFTYKLTSAGTPYLMQQGDQNCPYPADPPASGCFRMPSNTWMTLYMKVHIGTYDVANTSTLEGWYAVNGGAYVKWLNITANYSILSSGAGDFNNMTLTPYMTSLSTPAPVDAFIWYDEILVSTQPIAAPGQPVTGPAPPTKTVITRVNTQ